MRRDIIDDYARLDGTGPARQRGHAKAAFPGGTLLATERRGAAIRPAKFLHPVVRREDDDRIVRNSARAALKLVRLKLAFKDAGKVPGTTVKALSVTNFLYRLTYKYSALSVHFCQTAYHA